MGGFADARGVPPAAAGVAQPGELQEVLRGLPHNVTTEMDLKLWELTEEIRHDELLYVFTDLAVPERLQRYRMRLCRPLARGPPGILLRVIALSLRSTSACRAGQMIRATCLRSATTCASIQQS